MIASNDGKKISAKKYQLGVSKRRDSVIRQHIHIIMHAQMNCTVKLLHEQPSHTIDRSFNFFSYNLCYVRLQRSKRAEMYGARACKYIIKSIECKYINKKRGRYRIWFNCHGNESEGKLIKMQIYRNILSRHNFRFSSYYFFCSLFLAYSRSTQPF